MRIFAVDWSNSDLYKSNPGATFFAVLENLGSEHRFFLNCRFILVSTFVLLFFLIEPAASAAQPVVRVRSKTRIELSMSETPRPGVLAGTLRDSLGVPLKNQRIEVAASSFTDRKARVVVTTGSNGGFRVPVASDSTNYRVRARFDGNAFYEATQTALDTTEIDSSERHRVTQPKKATTAPGSALDERYKEDPQRLSVFWLLIPMVLCMGVVVANKRRLRSLKQKFECENQPCLSPGVKISIPIRSARRDRISISGMIRDLNSGDAVSDVELTLARELDTPISLDITSEGFFSSPSLRSGQWRIQARANGYVETTRGFVIPHRGEWTNVQIHMLSMRSLALQLYRKVALALLPTPQLWNIWTARETLSNSSRLLGPRSLFRSLVERVERSSYCRNPPSDEEVRTIEMQSSSVLIEISRGETDYTVTHRR